MNRRSFFRSLSSAVAGVYVACHVNLARVTESVSWSVTVKEGSINPEWSNAPYEVAFLISPAIYNGCEWKNQMNQPFPAGMGETVRGVK